MPVYEFTAVDGNGKQVKGTIDADNSRVARQKLRARGVFPTDIKEGIALSQTRTRDIKRWLQPSRASTKDLTVTTRQLATLIGAGLPVVSALQALTDQTESKVLKRIVIDVRESVEEGSTLAKAMGHFPRTFPRLYVNMIASGEASGTLDAVMGNLADYMEAQLELRRKITSALFYPALMLVFCILVIVGLLALVVPTIVDIFKKQGAVLPLPTRIVTGISDFIVFGWPYIILLVLASVYGLKMYYAQPQGRSVIDRLLLRAPVIGLLYTKMATARVASTLGALLASGVDLLASIEIARNIVANTHIAAALERAREGVQEGRSLAKELLRSGYFPPMLSHMVAVGEKSGTLDDMLRKAGKSYENDVDATLTGLTSLIEPLMIIVLGGIVFSIVISILLPMVELIDIIQLQ